MVLLGLNPSYASWVKIVPREVSRRAGIKRPPPPTARDELLIFVKRGMNLKQME